MPLATLSIDLTAKLAHLSEQMGKARLVVERELSGMRKNFDSVSSAMKRAGAALGVAFSAVAIARFAQRAIDGIDALGDLASAAGTTVEQMSALEDAARRTGTSLETAGDAVIKMNRTLSNAKPGGDTDKAIKALGLSVEELRKLDPVEALHRISIALAQFRDDQNKSAIVGELFGKSLKEVNKLLHDLAEQRRLTPTVTTEEWKAANQFNMELAELSKNADDAARKLAGPLVSAINAIAAEFRKGTIESHGFWAAINIGLAKRFPQFAFGMKKEELVGVRPGEVVARPPDEFDRGRFLRGDKDTSPVALPSLPQLTFGEGGAKKETKKPWNLEEWVADVTKAVNRAFIAADDEAREAERKDFESRMASVKETTAAMKDENLRLTVALIKDETARAKALILLDEQVKIKKLESLKIYGDAYEEQLAEIKKGTDLQLRALEEPADDLAKNLSDIFSEAAGQIATSFESAGDVAKQVLAEIRALVIRKTIIEPLGGWLDTILSSLPKILTSSRGNVFGRVTAFASGGVVNAPTLFGFGGGLGLMGEAGPEAVLPLRRGAGGKLGVAGGFNQVLNIAVDSRTDQAQVAQAVAAGVAEGNRALLRTMRAQGVLA